ncbi:hypothetical protein AMAG_19598 [Allomyces macrogynus ATCC 38327]|uniref:Uncharacterized protein n=1 Tax=Allomyces macrogynus (strain ATCC 38327) TaxID=578462 RepID=A0A0L0SVI0_ALLM3|nr:hypothetical protein AMAG_19598 [Allomyces macrogynus ATCC 38327]|eukprot:KNE66588.1 hypothetical protein AMAG_19598 [Allomyces macrogynus ATCC 38327]
MSRAATGCETRAWPARRLASPCSSEAPAPEQRRTLHDRLGTHRRSTRPAFSSAPTTAPPTQPVHHLPLLHGAPAVRALRSSNSAPSTKPTGRRARPPHPSSPAAAAPRTTAPTRSLLADLFPRTRNRTDDMAHLPSAPTPRSSAGSRPGGPLGAPRDASPTTSMRIQLLPDPGNDHTSARSNSTTTAPALGAYNPPPRPSRDNVPPIWATDAASLGPHLPSVHALARRGSNEPLLPPVLPALSPPPPPPSSTPSHLSPRNSLTPASTNTLNGSTNAPPPPWTVAAADPPPPLIDDPSLLSRISNVARARSANDPRRASAHSYSRSWAPTSTALRAFRNAAGPSHAANKCRQHRSPRTTAAPPPPHPQLPYEQQQQQHLHPSSGPAIFAHVEERGGDASRGHAGPRNSHRQVFPDDPTRHRRGQSSSANTPSSWAAMALSPFASLRRSAEQSVDGRAAATAIARDRHDAGLCH